MTLIGFPVHSAAKPTHVPRFSGVVVQAYLPEAEREWLLYSEEKRFEDCLWEFLDALKKNHVQVESVETEVEEADLPPDGDVFLGGFYESKRSPGIFSPNLREKIPFRQFVRVNSAS